MSSQSQQDSQRIMELMQELESTNQQLESQRKIVNNAQELLADLELPRDGKFRNDIASEILRTIKDQNCIYIPVDISYKDAESIVDKIRVNCPYKLEVVFPGMFKMYLILHDSLDNSIGFVTNPYLGIYQKDYYVTLLHFLKFVSFENGQTGIDHGFEGEVSIIKGSEYHANSPIDPDTIYIKVPFAESMIEGEA